MLSACTSAGRVQIVCYAPPENPITACQSAARAVLAQIGGSRPAAVAAVYPWRGCPPGAFCGLVRSTGQIPLSATVAIRFSDRSPSVIRDLDHVSNVQDVSKRRPQVYELAGIDADGFIAMLLHTRGASVTSIGFP
jgi:hypothetical protein